MFKACGFVLLGEKILTIYYNHLNSPNVLVDTNTKHKRENKSDNIKIIIIIIFIHNDC